MASNEIYKTRAGIRPSEKELPFSITTADVEEYLQRKLNVVVNGMRKDSNYTGEDIEVKVITVEMGSKFIPFTVVLPMSVLTNKRKRQPKEELSIFNPKDSDATVTIYEPIMRMFSSYTFDKADGEAFFSSDWRRARGVSTTTSAVLKRNRVPRVQKLNNGTMERVTFLIDPIRVFHDMLVMDDNATNFRIEIDDWQKIKSGEFRYDMTRVVSKKKGKKGGNNFADELNRKMRGLNK
jgi:hypothetical protein